MKYVEKTLKIETMSESVQLCGYIPDNCEEININRKRPAVLILPGGGYQMVSEREREPVAFKFLGEGICAFTLKYTVEPTTVFPQALCEAALAMDYIRTHAKEYNIDENNIAVCGFSAGGHLATTLGAFWDKDFVKDIIGKDKKTRPDKVILSYPVISSGEYAHRGSFENLLGDKKDDLKSLEFLSMEKQVTKEFPPVFIWHTFEDDAVPVLNSILFAKSLGENNVLTEMHIYPKGGHGLSLGNHLVYGDKDYSYKHESSEWIDKAVNFIYRY
ncbi:MAG TPA: alpha/beta hydrolase [Epulopiscium sp.]|nr:alpha/beta hydrolase [Candidatus Epulonipiscium sp.]